jgi:cell wall assembly regulator SMI1
MESNWPEFDAPGPPVTPAAVRDLEADLGVALPDDYRAFLLEVNGGQPKTHATFPLGRSRSTLNSLHSLNDPDDLFNLAEANATLRLGRELPADLLAIGADDGGAAICLCIRGEHRGEVWYFDTIDPRPEGANPRVLWHDRRDLRKLADSFRAFVASLTPR